MELARIIAAIENGYSVMLEGLGGSGKSHSLIKLFEWFRKEGKEIYCTATTGVAALNLSTPTVKASTLHRWAGIGLGDKPANALLAKVKYDARARERWKTANILIIDEVSMLGASLFDKLDYIGRGIRGKANIPFGGLILVLCGDFLQLPPVHDEWVFTSETWKALSLEKYATIPNAIIPVIFSQPKRYPDLEWFGLLSRVRRGEHTTDDIELLYSRKAAYDEWLKQKDAQDILTLRPTILHSRRVDVESENISELEKLPGKPVYFSAVDTFVPITPHARREFYEKILDDTIPKTICLNRGAQVMLKANLDIDAGLANGSRGVVVDLTMDSVSVKWRNGTVTIVSQYTWSQDDREGKMSRTQIPLILAYALTIHKIQGCTLDYAVCNLGPSVFCPGQAYVSLSRLRTSEGCFLSDFYPDSIMVDTVAFDYVHSIELRAEEEPEKFIMVFHDPVSGTIDNQPKPNTKAIPNQYIDTIVKYIQSSEADYIIQQCNCLTVRAHGLSEVLTDHFPHANVYGKRTGMGNKNVAIPRDRSTPGSFQLCTGKPNVVCLFGQWRPGSMSSKFVLSYPESTPPETNDQRILWFKSALGSFGEYISRLHKETKKQVRYKVAVPYKIGCGLAGGDWNRYESILDTFQKQYSDILTMTMYRPPDDNEVNT
jgi:ATP-dependent DNA helicase PIF1